MQRLVLVMLSVMLISHGKMVLANPCEGKIAINRASIKKLTSLPGIGKKKALSIVRLRKEQPIIKIETLVQVKGIGKKILAKIGDKLCVQPQLLLPPLAPIVKPITPPPPGSGTRNFYRPGEVD